MPDPVQDKNLPDPKGDTGKTGAEGAPKLDDKGQPIVSAAAPKLDDKGQPVVVSGDEAAKQKAEAEAKEKAEAEAKALLPPEKYEFKFADEKLKLDEGLVSKFTPIAKELGLNNAKAQKLADLFLEHTHEQTKQQSKAFTDQIEGWRKEFSADPKHELILASAKRALSIADADTKKLFESEWVGNHPLVIRFLAKLGDALREDTLAEGSRPTSTGSAGAKSLYPSMQNP